MTNLYQVRLHFIISLSCSGLSHKPEMLVSFFSTFSFFFNTHKLSHPIIFSFFLVLISFFLFFFFLLTSLPFSSQNFFFLPCSNFFLFFFFFSSYLFAFLIPEFFFFFLLFLCHPKLKICFLNSQKKEKKICFSVGLCCLWWHWVCGLRSVWLWVVYGGVLLGGWWVFVVVVVVFCI